MNMINITMKKISIEKITMKQNAVKTKWFAIVLSVCTFVSGQAFVCSSAFADCEPTFYVGGEVQANKMSGEKKIVTPKGSIFSREDGKPFFGRSAAGASIFAGSRITENFGVELGGTSLSNVHGHENRREYLFKNFSGFRTSKLTTKTTNVYGDLLGYIPVSPEFDLIGSVGVGQLSSKVTGKSTLHTNNRVYRSEHFSMKSKKAGPRFGAGIGYNFNENLSARLMVRHQKGNKFIKNVTSTGVGLVYNF